MWEPLSTALLERGFAAQDFPVIPDIFPKLIVLPSPGDLTGIVVIVRHRSFSGCGYPQRRQDNSLDRPEIDKAALVDEIDGLFDVGKAKPPASVVSRQQDAGILVNNTFCLSLQIPYKNWQQAYARWEKLYYCGRDDVIFIPGEKTSAPVADMMVYVHSFPHK